MNGNYHPVLVSSLFAVFCLFLMTLHCAWCSRLTATLSYRHLEGRGLDTMLTHTL